MKYTFLIIPIYLFSSSSFITPMEYASQLYKNPRGIGCQNCHGKDGEGMVIATYKHKNKDKQFVAPKIDEVDYDKFYKALNSRIKGMPRYFLTDNEIDALYLYLHNKDENEY